MRLFGGLGGPLGGHWVALGAIWGSFGSHFGDFSEVSGISKNVCSIKVKLYFFRLGRVLVRDFFVLCFCIDTFRVFFHRILLICWSSGFPWGPKWVSFGDPQGPN